MKILVTGGAGFIGSHLVKSLLKEGHTPVVIDNLSTGLKSNVPEGVEVYFNDCRDKKSLSQAAYGCEFCYHLASTVGVEKVLNDPIECINNVIGTTRNVLSLVEKGIDFSTSEVYGKNTQKLAEHSDLVYSSKERWAYATSKLIGEWMANSRGWKSVRLFNIVGPRQASGYVLSNFVRQAVNNEDITIFGTGKQVRTFLDVRDAVSILSSLRTKEFDVVNVGGVHIKSIIDTANLVKETLRSQSEITTNPYNKAYAKGFEEVFEDCMYRVPDLTKLHRIVGETSYISLEKTIKDSAEELRKKQ